MPEDMKIPFEYDGTGDVATVEGEEFYYRHALQLALIATEDVKGGPLTESDIVEIQDTIGRQIVSSPYFGQPVSIEIVDRQDEEIVAEVTVSNADTFDIEI